ncbi:MAG: agmatine deiminase family protein [Planctomycetaceae bacterium]|nr:agmatine deiminase family protein [Planctomycetaceae bacterium]MBT4157472.1 agmatine deiminase family protein [Planctomycetaceae bacterium]MBT6459950.1 agmatine deiminase family protein [Planctomycetaceae bacterium]MBT6918667.1 agmatine deiminase family protein [Planctomycetaceae bacterium]MBT7728397.1 agmatine deiminase family protein [Planctomycetaceae bacterium]
MSSQKSDYRLPAEWEPHAATWVAWPHRRATFLGNFDEVPVAFSKLVMLLARYEPVKVIGSEAVLRDASSQLQESSRVEFIEIPTNDSWLRDTGPVFLKSEDEQQELVVVNFGFNAWGGKYSPWDADAAVAVNIARCLGSRVLEAPIVLEGGAIETDGEGTLLVNHRCIDDPLRNPKWSREELAAGLQSFLGAKKVLWANGALAGDDTDGHIDQLARFVAPGCVVAARQPDRSDPNHESLEANFDLLKKFKDACGRLLDVVPIDLPPNVCFGDVQLPASYLNFSILNGGVIVPTFQHELDINAIKTIQKFFPQREVIAFPALELIRGRGAVHCVTSQQPALECSEAGNMPA